LAAADVIVFPYRHTEESASGALRFVLPVGRPVIVTDLPIFDDARGAALLVDATDLTKLKDGVRGVLTDSDLRRDMAERAASAARRDRWSRVVAAHREIYTGARTASRHRAAAELPSMPNVADVGSDHTVEY
jgi:glycosyltransferase involved in cell wall biosynthesis